MPDGKRRPIDREPSRRGSIVVTPNYERGGYHAWVEERRAEPEGYFAPGDERNPLHRPHAETCEKVQEWA